MIFVIALAALLAAAAGLFFGVNKAFRSSPAAAASPCPAAIEDIEAALRYAAQQTDHTVIAGAA